MLSCIQRKTIFISVKYIMSRRSKTSLENDIERSRWEEKWEHIPKLVEQVSSRTTSESSIGK